MLALWVSTHRRPRTTEFNQYLILWTVAHMNHFLFIILQGQKGNAVWELQWSRIHRWFHEHF